jgi:myo-inositol-1(or 4)-monophosphatase
VSNPQNDMLDDVDFGWLEEIVRSAGDIALKHFRRVTTARKADNTVVTVADREVEVFLQDALHQAFPADSLLGEEFGTRGGQSGRLWAIDPIDGTASYAAGLPVWGVSVGILQDWEPVAGIFFMPLLEELYVSHGYDALFNDHSIHIDGSNHIDDESFLTVTSAAHRKYRINFIGKTRALGSTAANICYVARGTAVAALLGRPSLWDIAGVLPILRVVGGDLRCLSGRPLDLAALADGRRCPDPVLAGAPWALEYFSQRIEVMRK